MPGFGGTVSPRRLRVWRTDTGAVWVVITERGAGTSITNVADVVVPLIRARYASARVVEHYPPEPGSPEHFDEIVSTAECLRWHRIRVEEIVALLGEQVLDDVPVLPPDPQPSRAVTPTVTVAGPGLPDDAVIRGYPGGLVVVADSAGTELGPLTHFVRHSPTGFGWGYGVPDRPNSPAASSSRSSATPAGAASAAARATWCRATTGPASGPTGRRPTTRTSSCDAWHVTPAVG